MSEFRYSGGQVRPFVGACTNVQQMIKEAEKWTFKSNIWKPKISFFVIKKP